MVIGLDIFTQHFENYTTHYLLIGGSACDRQMQEKGIPFRATKDLDIILIVESITDEFVNHFWQFIKNGEYSIAQVGDKKSFYRFIKPQTAGYPYMLELFSRVPDQITEVEGMHLTDIPTGEEASSLSAILLNEEYYAFTLANTNKYESLHLANDMALICLKAKAFLNNKKRKDAGEEVREDDIVKHKNDVIKLTATLTPNIKIEIPEIIRVDLQEFIGIVKAENPDIKSLLANQNMGEIALPEIFEQLTNSFGLI